MIGVFTFWGCFWLVVLSLIYVCAGHIRSKGLLLLGLGLLVCFSLVSFSPAWFLASLSMFVIAACWPVKTRPGMLTVVCGGIVAVACGFVVLGALHRLQELTEWQHEFAFRSVADRLRYEDRAQSDAAAAIVSAPLKPEIAARLVQFEESSYERTRTQMLRRLHDDTRAEFEVLTGFGPIRMMELHRRYLELPPDAPVPQLQPADAAWEFDERWTSLEDLPIPELEQDRLLSLHDIGLSDFLDADRMGYVVDRDHVAGFDSHRFTKVPELYAADGANRWDVERLELIGLLSHDRPVAYVTEFLPDLEELGDAATRELDEFEQAGLEQLRSEQDLVTSEHESQIRMLGSVRASQSCLECHSVARGDLLGAFSYVIAPQGSGGTGAIAVVE